MGSRAPKACYHRGVLGRVFFLLREHRRRIAPLVLGAAVLVVGGEWQAHAPSDIEVELPIGAVHHDVTRIDVRYEEGEELVQAVSLRYPDGAPERVRHIAHLPPGRYTIAVELGTRDARTITRTGELEAPSEGLVRIALEGT